jgi:hypothetical protein
LGLKAAVGTGPPVRRGDAITDHEAGLAQQPALGTVGAGPSPRLKRRTARAASIRSRSRLATGVLHDRQAPLDVGALDDAGDHAQDVGELGCVGDVALAVSASTIEPRQLAPNLAQGSSRSRLRMRLGGVAPALETDLSGMTVAAISEP